LETETTFGHPYGASAKYRNTLVGASEHEFSFSIQLGMENHPN
jgi:hypothetical protein